MGINLTKFVSWKKLSNKKVPKVHVGIFGLSGAGKTTILERIKPDEILNINVDLDISEYGIPYFDMHIFNMSTQKRLLYNDKLDVVIYVVDASNSTQLSLLMTDFYKIANHPKLEQSFFIIFANKQDQEVSLKADDLVDLLDLPHIYQSWVIHECIALTGHVVSSEAFNLMEVVNSLAQTMAET